MHAFPCPIGSMVYLPTFIIYHKHQPNVAKYTYHHARIIWVYYLYVSFHCCTELQNIKHDLGDWRIQKPFRLKCVQKTSIAPLNLHHVFNYFSSGDFAKPPKFAPVDHLSKRISRCCLKTYE